MKHGLLNTNNMTVFVGTQWISGTFLVIHLKKSHFILTTFPLHLKFECWNTHEISKVSLIIKFFREDLTNILEEPKTFSSLFFIRVNSKTIIQMFIYFRECCCFTLSFPSLSSICSVCGTLKGFSSLWLFFPRHNKNTTLNFPYSLQTMSTHRI